MLLAAYQAYYILAGIAGLALYPWLANRCLYLFLEYRVNSGRGGHPAAI